MTSSNEPQLTRRELRELERLREQQAGAATPDQAAPPAAAPTSAPPPAQAPAAPPQQYAPQPPAPQPVAAPVMPAPVPAPAPPQPAAAPVPYQAPGQGFAPPRPAGGFEQSAPVTAVPQQAPQNPFAQRPAAQAPVAPAQPQPAMPAAAPAPSAPAAPGAMPSAPERTLTRRELRAMLDGVALDDFDDEFDDEPVAPPAATPSVAGAQQAAHLPQQPMPPSLATPQPVVNPGFDTSVPNLPGVSAGSPGHWTSQLNVADAEDRAEPFDQVLSRGALSHGVPTTTNALILPSLPDQGAFANQLAQPGEVLATGSIDLPRSYGATGVHPSQVDSSEVDRLFEHQVEDVGTGVAPIAATRAISTQGAARTMISPPKKEGVNVPLVLAVTAGVLALGVVGTLVIGAMTGLF